MAERILALDLGTTSAKALVVDADQRVLARAERAIETRSARPGWSEQDVVAIQRAAADAVSEARALSPSPPDAVALSCAMHGVVPLDASGAPLAPLRTWGDSRGAVVAEALRATGAHRALQHRCGTPVHASSPLCKLAAMRADEPELFGAAALFVSAKEFLLRAWCQSAVVDLSLASATGLLELATGTWDTEALALAGVDPERLSRLVPTRHVVEATAGPLRGLPVVVGASDGCLANLGVGAMGDGVAAVTLGTSGAARIVDAVPSGDEGAGLFCYALDDGEWVVGGAVNDMGNAVRLVAESLFPDESEPVAALLAAAASSVPGAHGARFVPGLFGRRFPDYRSEPSGGFVDEVSFDAADLGRAVLEGVIDGLGAVVDALRARGSGVRSVRAGGGLVRAPLVQQILADRVGVPLEVGEDWDASALGAARLARRALG
ncbi:MAG: gluconokinase [Planctomycetota bacterium]|nr:gluconokinase [Planctomycetota bacterium]